MKKPFFKTFIGNLTIIILLCVALYWIFFGALSLITRHNDVKIVPTLTGKDIKEAIKLLEKEGFEIKVDSVYDNTKPLLQVLEQQPEAGFKVKSGRIIFLTVNKSNTPMIDMPNFVGLNMRGLALQLKKINIQIGDTTYVYDEAEETILEQWMNGHQIKAGTKIPEGAVIDIVVSKGLSTEQVAIPDVIGKTYEEAKKIIEDKELRFKVFFEGTISDSATALAYTQYPESRNEYGEALRVYKGQSIDVRIKQNPEIEKKTYKQRPVDWTSSSDDDSENSSDPASSSSSSTTTPTTRPSTTTTTNPTTKPATTTKPENNAPSNQNNSEEKKNRPVRPTRN